MRQYEMFELSFRGQEPAGSQAVTDVEAVFRHGEEEVAVKGFYCGEGVYKVRYYPCKPGPYNWKVSSSVSLEGELTGNTVCEPAAAGRHGMVRAKGLHFEHEDKKFFYPFGTTIYALVHQEESLMDQTMESLKQSPFNKVRLCVFPKSYDYNMNEPDCFPFEKTGDKWDVHRPCFRYWEKLEQRLCQLDELDMEADLILFHGYDRWGFSELSEEEALTYLDYLLRRLAAFPNMWWSLANEYEVVEHFKREWWYDFAEFIGKNDPYKHLLSNHNFMQFWDFANKNVTHCSIQDNNVIRVPELQKEYGKPVIFDECCYEGNIIHPWGNISGFELTHRFWTAVVMGGYCTHGETFLDDSEVLWWSKGGTLHGESPRRIGFLRSIIEELPGPLDYVPSAPELAYEGGGIELPENPEYARTMNLVTGLLKQASEVRRQGNFDKERIVLGCCGDKVYLRYYGRQCAIQGELELPVTGSYDIEVIDIWEMTRTPLLQGVHGTVKLSLPGKEGIAVLAKKKA